MSDEKTKKDGAGGTPEEKAPKKDLKDKGRIGKIADHILVQFGREYNRPIARWIIKNIPEPLVDWAKTWEKVLPTVSTILATLTPDGGIWTYIDDFQQDIFAAVREELNNPTAETHVDKKVADAAKIVQAQTTQYARIWKTVATLSQQKRDTFLLWFSVLKGNPEKLNRFYELTAAMDDTQLKTFLELHPKELDTIIDNMPAKAKVLTPLQLEAAVRKDTALNQKIADFLTRNPAHKAEFWKAVEKNKIDTLEVFQDLMTLDDDLIIRHLGLDKPSVGEKIKTIIADVNKPPVAPNGLNRAIDNLKAGNSALLGKLLKRGKTPGTGGVP
jgi:hypothetical protein